MALESLLADIPVTDPPTDYGLMNVPDIDFAVKDPAVIRAQIILAYEQAFQALTGVAKSLAPGDPVRLFLLVLCDWLSQQRTIIDFTGKSNLLKYARGDYLDNLAALHGLRGTRQPAAPALTTLQLTLGAVLSFDARIPAGTLCQAPNSIVFATTVDGLIPSGQLTVSVPAQASIAGIVGNGFLPGQINSVINWNQVFGIFVTNLDVTANGADPETDDQYRYRIWLAIESYSTCGPRAAYEFWALSAHPDIIQCVVHSAPDIAGEVWLYPLLRNGQLPSEEILALVLARCSADTVRPITDYVTAYAPTPVEYSLNMTFYIRQSDAALVDSITTKVNQAVTDWILWQRLYVGRDLNCEELIRRCLNAGAKRIVISSPDPPFQPLLFNQLACHTTYSDPMINYGGTEEESSGELS
jgi:phage-related baseplate assembly protein